MPHDELIIGFLSHADAVTYDYHDINFWAYLALETLIDQDVEAAWQTIIKIIQSVHEDETLGYVSASVLEDLIGQHPYILIERIEELARADAHFKQALVNVWGWCLIPPEIRTRIDNLIVDLM